MRVTCLLCVRKHLGQAEALMTEVGHGYPQHAGLAIGHMAEAAAEAMQDYPKLAETIRTHWKAFELDEDGYEVPTVSILKTVEELLQAKRVQQEAAKALMPDQEGDAATPVDRRPDVVKMALDDMSRSGEHHFKPEGAQLPPSDAEAAARAATTLAGAGKVDMSEVGTEKPHN